MCDRLAFASWVTLPIRAAVVDAASVSHWNLGDPVPQDYQVIRIGEEPPKWYEVAVDDLAASPVHGDLPSTLRISDKTVASALTAAPGYTVLLLIDSIEPVVRGVAFQDDVGNVAFVGECRSGLSFALEHFRSIHPEHDRGTGIATLVALFSNENGAATDLAESLRNDVVAWADRDPSERLVDPETTPADVFDGLKPITLRVAIPDAWQSQDLTVCTRIPSIGWNECSRTSASDEAGVVMVRASSNPGEDLELWLLDGSANILEPVLFLGPIASTFAERADNGVILVQIAEDASDLSDAAERAGGLIAQIADVTNARS